MTASPPSRGAWIEIVRHLILIKNYVSRPPRGGRGLKLMVLLVLCHLLVLSPPSRGAWIEIVVGTSELVNLRESPPTRGAWIEMLNQIVGFLFKTSPPSRGAWIEITVDK